MTDPRTSLHCRWCCETFATPAAAQAHQMATHCIDPTTIPSLEHQDGKWHKPRQAFGHLQVGAYAHGAKPRYYFQTYVDAHADPHTTRDERAVMVDALTRQYEAERAHEPRGLLPAALVKSARTWCAARHGADALEGIPEPVARPAVEAQFPWTEGSAWSEADDVETTEGVPTGDVDLDTGHAEEQATADGRRGARDLGAPPPEADHDDANPLADDQEARRVMDHLLAVWPEGVDRAA